MPFQTLSINEVWWLERGDNLKKVQNVVYIVYVCHFLLIGLNFNYIKE